MDDKEFLTDLLCQIAKYARKKGMSVDDTIRAIANDFLVLLEFATFEELEKSEDLKQ